MNPSLRFNAVRPATLRRPPFVSPPPVVATVETLRLAVATVHPLVVESVATLLFEQKLLQQAPTVLAPVIATIPVAPAPVIVALPLAPVVVPVSPPPLPVVAEVIPQTFFARLCSKFKTVIKFFGRG